MTKNQAAGILRVFALSAALSLSLPIHAAELDSDVPLPLVKALLQSPLGDDVHVYLGIPDNFPSGINIPREFSILGGVDLGRSQRLVLQTSTNRDAALDALSTVLTAVGFVDIQTLSGMRASGFVVPESMLARRTFCRDDVGYITLAYSAQPYGNLLSLSTSNTLADSGMSSCQQIRSPARGPYNTRQPSSGVPMIDLMQYMPRLDLPGTLRDSIPNPFFSSGGSSSGGSHAETENRFRSDMSIPALHKHFADQIRAQGWTSDGEVTGQFSATGNWIKIPDADTYLYGSISILQTSEANFSVRFRLNKLTPEP